MDRDLRFLRVNEQLAELNELSVAEHTGRSVCDVIPELWPRLAPYYHRVLETGDTLIEVEVQVPPRGHSQVEATTLESYYPVVSHGAVVAVGAVVVRDHQRRHSRSPHAVGA